MSDPVVWVLNGPSLNLLGEREPEVYGTTTLADVEARVRETAAAHGLQIEFRQSNEEGVLIDWVHEARKTGSGIVINPAAFTHYSLALRDALAAVGIPIVEIHLSNIFAREEWRAKSVVSGVAAGVVVGFGIESYVLGIEALAGILKKKGT